MIKVITFLKSLQKNYSSFISSYLLILLGLVMISWILWSRFLRERTIRDVPDELFTEFRFWILAYISLIYFYSVKNLIKPKTENTIFLKILGEISKIFYLPLEKLDHSIKYQMLKDYFYRKVLYSFVFRMHSIPLNYLVLIIFLLQILPRIILVSFLLLDTFKFHRLEIFYKVVLLGLLPFFYRYFIYSLRNHYEYLVTLLTNYYDLVRIDRIDDDDEEKKKYYYNYYGKYSGMAKMKITEEKQKDPYYEKYISMEEYIELKYENYFDYLSKDVDYEYIGYAYTKNEVRAKYLLEKYSNSDRKATYEDIEEMRRLFKELIPEIIEIKTFLERSLPRIKKRKIIKWSQIVIFSLYGICWSFILIISYRYYPVEFNMFKYLINNIILYLLLPEDPFLMVDSYSRNVNLITVETIILLMKTLWQKITFLK